MKRALTAGTVLTASIYVLAAMVIVLSAMVPYSLLAAKYVPPPVNLGLVGIFVLGGALTSIPLARRVVRWLQTHGGIPERTQ